jgi:hypothetical protein
MVSTYKGVMLGKSPAVSLRIEGLDGENIKTPCVGGSSELTVTVGELAALLVLDLSECHCGAPMATEPGRISPSGSCRVKAPRVTLLKNSFSPAVSRFVAPSEAVALESTPSPAFPPSVSKWAGLTVCTVKLAL